MKSYRPLLFRKPQFQPVIIVTSYGGIPVSRSLRDLEELIAERSLPVDYTTI